MNSHKKSTYRIALKYGLIITGITALFSVIFLLFGLYRTIYRIRENEETLLYLLSLVGVVVYAVYGFKKTNNGLLSMGMAIKMGVLIALVAALGWILYNFVFITILYPDYYMDYYYGPLGEQAWESYLAIDPDTHTRERYALHAEEALSREFTGLYPLTLIMSILVGLLVSSIAGAFLKKNVVM